MYDPRAGGSVVAVLILAVTLVGLLGVVPGGSAVAVGTADSGSHDAGLSSRVGTDLPTLATETPTATATPTATPTPTPDEPLSGVTNETESTTETVTNTTENVTGTVANATENATDSVTNTTENVTGTVTNTTGTLTNGTGDLLDGTTTLTGTVSVVANVSVGAGSTATGTGTLGLTGTTASPTSGDTAGAEAGTGEGTGTPATAVRDDSTERASGSVTAAAPADRRGGSGGSSPLPSSGGAALGGLVVGGVVVAAVSRQVAATTSVSQGQELVWVARAARSRLETTASVARTRLARLPRFLLPFGYSRYDDSDPLEHDLRESLFETVERTPGINLSTLAEESDSSLSSVRHHLRILEEENLIVGERIRGKRRYFLSTESEPELVAALDDTATEPILRTLAASGPASVSDLAEDLGRDPSTISHHVSRLENDGLIERERDGQSVQNSLVPVAERVLSPRAGGKSRSVATE